MKGWRFYEEFKTERRKVSAGSVVAIDTTTGMYAMPPFGPNAQYRYECVSALFDGHNQPVCSGAISVRRIEKRCKRISEAKARTIHPKLFEYLDQETL